MKELIEGGMAEGMPDSEFPQDQIQKGIKIEAEHTDNPAIAKYSYTKDINFIGINNLDQLIKKIAKKDKNIEDKIIDFFSENDNPLDKKFHALADKLGVDPDDLETQAYDLITSFFSHGKSKEFTGRYDENELKIGIQVEMEHTNNPKMAKRIAMDHLAEFNGKLYYTELLKLEKKLKKLVKE